jgi:putative spermidine/putrescine transport system permease protein
MLQAVADPTLSHALPRLSASAPDWTGEGVPPPAVQAAFVEDLRSIDDDQTLGEVVRRLNSAKAGFRTLLSRTVAAIRDPDAAEAAASLPAIDPRWNDPAYWKTIVDALPPYTDRHLLAALDLRRGADGSIAVLPDSDSANRAIMLRTFTVSALVTGLALLIGMPYAMIAAGVEGWRRQLMLVAVLLPLWTSLLVRTSAWYVLLQDKGLINGGLMALGLIDHPLPLLFNRIGVVVAMTHVLLPLMVLPIYSVVLSIPRNLMPAAGSLGATPLAAFRHVLLPLSLRGVAAGCLLVFISALGYYITPALIGGAQDQMISSVIAFYAMGSANWGMASALGLILLCATVVLYGFYARISDER